MRRKISAMPSFKIGPAHTLSAYAMDRKPVPVSNDSSYSEQAWDNYQEKYMSEPYSEEPPDSEAARRLLEFGDDYRNFLDSQSDCASSSLGRNTFHRRPRKIQHMGETDSDLDDVWNLINTSKDRLHFSEQVFKNQLSRASPHLVLASDFAELVSTCKDNVKVLKVVLENLEDVTSLMSEQECKELRGLIERWEGLEKKSEDLQKVRFFTREISALKEQLLEIGDRVARFDVKVEDRDQLELRIEDVQREVGRLKSLKPSLLQVNVAVHRFLTETGNAEGPSTLKDEVAELYSTFDETCTKVFSVEENLKDVTKAWQQFESYLATLQIALRSDSENLRKLDEALSQEEGVGGGKVSTHIATSVKDIAKLLSEKEQVIKLNDTQSIYEMMTGGGGNYSDSGISDSGSEVDLSEREKRLAALRRLVRHLEAVLAPGSAAIVNMSKRIEQTEKELRGLQVTCRELIDRTNVYVESKAPPHLGNGFPNGGAARGEGDDNETSGGKIKAWLWRAIRAGLPFQLAVMAILCIACLLEPQCCDAMNNFPYSISPQLRYVKGPPPV
uniref:Nuclear anchorage protein 1 n=2 Tax=Lygus hesperus TaxID=30085 RepID=A0A0A9WYK8_LYGHE